MSATPPVAPSPEPKNKPRLSQAQLAAINAAIAAPPPESPPPPPPESAPSPDQNPDLARVLAEHQDAVRIAQEARRAFGETTVAMRVAQALHGAIDRLGRAAAALRQQAESAYRAGLEAGSAQAVEAERAAALAQMQLAAIAQAAGDASTKPEDLTGVVTRLKSIADRHVIFFDCPGTPTWATEIFMARIDEARERTIALDDAFTDGQLAVMAAGYAVGHVSPACHAKIGWPLKRDDPSGIGFGFAYRTPRENLIRAAALIIAEIERLDRRAERMSGQTVDPNLAPLAPDDAARLGRLMDVATAASPVSAGAEADRLDHLIASDQTTLPESAPAAAPEARA